MLWDLLVANFGSFANLDLLALGAASAAALILGVIVFLNDRKSATNRSFLLFLLITIAYSVANYLQYQFAPASAFAVLRITIFLAVWHAFSLFQLFLVFPRTSAAFPRWHTFAVIPLTFLVSLLTLTPLVFNRIGTVTSDGRIATIVNGPGIAVFGAAVFALIVSAIVLLIARTVRAAAIERRQFLYVMTGTFLTFLLLLVFNFIFPALLDDSRFIALAPVWFLPFICFTYYATIKHHLLKMKVISAELLVLTLAIATLLEVILTKDPLVLVFRVGVFILVLCFGVLLIRSVRREVEQREELERLTKQLGEANTKLGELSRFKTQLLSLASHQIKSPLAVIRGFTSLLLEGLYGPIPEKGRETLTKIERASRDLINLINTLLDVRKVEEGKMEYKFAPIDFGALVADAVEGLRPLADAKKIELRFESAPHALSVSADAEKLKQVIINLVDNAIKYTPQGSVRVAVTEEGNSALFTVADSGLGIPADLVPHLFEEFARGAEVKAKILGTGLGLFIAKKIVEAHSGTIAAASPGEGKGSTFTVRLPKMS